MPIRHGGSLAKNLKTCARRVGSRPSEKFKAAKPSTADATDKYLTRCTWGDIGPKPSIWTDLAMPCLNQEPKYTKLSRQMGRLDGSASSTHPFSVLVVGTETGASDFAESHE